MTQFNQILGLSIGNNLIRDYLIAIGIFIAILIGLDVFKRYIIHALKKAAKKTKTKADDFLIHYIDHISWWFYIIIAVFISSKYLVLPNIANNILYYILIIGVVYYFVKGLNKTVDYIAKKEVKKRHEADVREGTSLIKTLSTIVKATVWIIAFLMILSNLGINITSLVAGLGVGGIAIAFALQNILQDVFSSFTIYFDKPFTVGDFIIIGTDMGTVEHIGIKTTRIKTLQGQELIVSNRELTSTRINNYKRMEKRRIAFNIGLEYGTSVKKLKKAKQIIAKVINDVKGVDLSRVHFKQFGDFSLNYEIIYILNSSDYNVYMDKQEEINLKIKELFEKEKIGIAFPTQTIHLKK
jgi:small-conductance mechanosensitive channel